MAGESSLSIEDNRYSEKFNQRSCTLSNIFRRGCAPPPPETALQPQALRRRTSDDAGSSDREIAACAVAGPAGACQLSGIPSTNYNIEPRCSRRHSSEIFSTMPSTEQCPPVWRRMSFSTCSQMLCPAHDFYFILALAAMMNQKSSLRGADGKPLSATGSINAPR